MMITAARVDNITNPYQTKAKKVLYPSIPLRIVVLNLPDIFEWNSTDLIRLITKQYEDSVTMERAFA